MVVTRVVPIVDLPGREVADRRIRSLDGTRWQGSARGCGVARVRLHTRTDALMGDRVTASRDLARREITWRL
jgi:hypothetical protein